MSPSNERQTANNIAMKYFCYILRQSKGTLSLGENEIKTERVSEWLWEREREREIEWEREREREIEKSVFRRLEVGYQPKSLTKFKSHFRPWFSIFLKVFEFLKISYCVLCKFWMLYKKLFIMILVKL